MANKIQDEAFYSVLLDIAASGRWREFEFSELAEELDLELSALQIIYNDKNSMLVAFAEYIDALTLQGLDDEIKDGRIPIRERLLETLLVRFDALNPYKKGVVELMRLSSHDPNMLIVGAKSLKHSMKLSLEAVGISVLGIKGILRIKGLAGVFLWGLHAWSNEEDSDFSGTTRVLDERLKLAESIAISLGLATERQD